MVAAATLAPLLQTNPGELEIVNPGELGIVNPGELGIEQDTCCSIGNDLNLSFTPHGLIALSLF